MILGLAGVLWHCCFSDSGHASCRIGSIAPARSAPRVQVILVMVRLNNPEDWFARDLARRVKSADDLKPLVIRPVGDMTSCEQVGVLFQRCRRVIGEAGRRAVVLDLLDVGQADTKLVACLVAVYQMSRDSSVRLEMRASRVVLDLFELCRLQRLVDQTAPAG
jgi:ABC-type transporter Mla MlaB component